VGGQQDLAHASLHLELLHGSCAKHAREIFLRNTALSTGLD
jgi:hypothetical protein